MAKRLWCVLLTAVMLLNLLPVGMADNEEPVEPLTAEEMQQEVQEVIEETLPAEVEIQPEEPEEPEEEAAEEALPKEEETEPVEEFPEGTLELLTDGVIPEIEELSEEELSEELEAAEVLPEDEEIAEEEDGGDEYRRPLKREELERLGIDPNQTVYELTSDYGRIRAGTYTITQNVVNNNNAWIRGTVKIYLPDGLKLNFRNGLNVGPTANLTIATPEHGSGTGALEAHGRKQQAGIGGGYREGCGIIYINGGVIRAYGGEGAAGIGGGDDGGGGGNVVITAGDVRAEGGRYGAGIGGGNGGYGGAKTITGGTVYAKGGELAAGIGGGSRGHSDGEIRITDNNGMHDTNVTAEGGANAAGIGGGNFHGITITSPVNIIGSKVTVNATGGVNAAGIGGGSDGGSGGTVNINGSTVTATGGQFGAGIGGGRGGSAGVITISGGTVKDAKGGANAAGIGTGYQGRGGIVTIKGGKVTAHGGQNSSSDVRGGDGIGAGSRGQCDSVLIEGGDVTAVSAHEGIAIGSDNVTINNGTVRAQGGWSGGGIGGGKVTINGGNVTASGNNSAAGIGGEVTINGGTVTANGGRYGAGIGGGSGGSAGVVTINGGIVKATGGSFAAGIGGGDSGHGGNVTITGGQVRAYGGDDGPFHGGGAGIGGGYRGSGGTVTITGGDVEAVGRVGAPGIGRGPNGRETGTLRVSPELEVFNASAGNRRIADPTAQKLDSVTRVRIGKLVLDPRVGNPTYNGREQRGYINPEVHVHIEGTTSAKDVGNYTFTVTPEPGYTWFDCTNAPRTFNWSINRAKATVRANDLTITYGDKEPELTATVRGTVNGDRLNYQISRQPGTNAGRYTITVSGEKVQGYYDVSYQNGTFTIRPKNIPGTHRTEFQEIKYGSGEFTEPTFHDSSLDEDITGTLTYYYSGRSMTGEQLRTVLAGLPAGARGTIGWNFEANGNFAGTITGSIHFTVSRLAFTVDGAPATAANTVTIKNNPTYGDTWEELVTISDRIVASAGREVGSGTYTLNVSGTPNAGRHEYSVLFTGLVGRLTYTNVTVLTGEVDIAKADYKDVTKTASGELEPEAGRSVIITLPEIPQGTSYGTPRKNVESDPYRLFNITGNQIPVALTDIPENTNPMTFTVPVIPADSNHNGYDITVTLTVKSGAHTHFFRYTASGHQIAAVCRAANCPLPESRVTLTLTAPANLTYDGKAKEVTFAKGEAEAWKAATGNNAPTITYTADRGSALTGGKPVNAGSYTASISVYGQRASVRFTVSKAEYTDAVKEASGELNAARNSQTAITLPALPRGARYGTPVKANRNDPYSLSGISGNRITVRSSGIPEDVDAMIFTVPVLPDANHNGYTVTVTVNVIQPKITVSVKVSRGYLRTGLLLLSRVPTYTATITAGYTEPSAQTLRVAYSLTGSYYTTGSQFTSLLPIQRLYIRVTDSNNVHYYYRYENGRTFPR